MCLTSIGKMIRVDMQSISKSSRNTSGVYIVKGDDVVSIARCPKIEEDLSEREDTGDLKPEQEQAPQSKVDEDGNDTLF